MRRTASLLVIITALLLCPISFASQTTQPAVGPDEVILKRSEPAPYAGVLIWDARYREQKEQIEMCTYNETHLPQECVGPKVNPFAWLMSGVLLGFLGGLATAHR